MKFGIWAVLLIGALVGGSLIVHGIRNDEPGFWLWAGFVIVGVFLLVRKMKQLRDNPPSKRLALVPFFLLQDTLILGDSAVPENGSGIGGWLIIVGGLAAVVALLFVGIWFHNRRKRQRTTGTGRTSPNIQLREWRCSKCRTYNDEGWANCANCGQPRAAR